MIRSYQLVLVDLPCLFTCQRLYKFTCHKIAQVFTSVTILQVYKCNHFTSLQLQSFYKFTSAIILQVYKCNHFTSLQVIRFYKFTSVNIIFQVIGMLFHRWGTISHIIATTKLAWCERTTKVGLFCFTKRSSFSVNARK